MSFEIPRFSINLGTPPETIKSVSDEEYIEIFEQLNRQDVEKCTEEKQPEEKQPVAIEQKKKDHGIEKYLEKILKRFAFYRDACAQHRKNISRLEHERQKHEECLSACREETEKNKREISALLNEREQMKSKTREYCNLYEEMKKMNADYKNSLEKAIDGIEKQTKQILEKQEDCLRINREKEDIKIMMENENVRLSKEIDRQILEKEKYAERTAALSAKLVTAERELACSEETCAKKTEELAQSVKQRVQETESIKKYLSTKEKELQEKEECRSETEQLLRKKSIAFEEAKISAEKRNANTEAQMYEIEIQTEHIERLLNQLAGYIKQKESDYAGEKRRLMHVIDTQKAVYEKRISEYEEQIKTSAKHRQLTNKLSVDDRKKGTKRAKRELPEENSVGDIWDAFK